MCKRGKDKKRGKERKEKIESVKESETEWGAREGMRKE